MKRYDKDGNEVKKPDCLKNLEWSCDCSDVGMQICLNKKSEFEKALTPQQMAERIKELESKLNFLESKGLTVGMLKTSDKPEPYLTYVIKEGSELCDLHAVNMTIDLGIKLEESQKENQRLRDDINKAMLKDYSSRTDLVNDINEILQTKQNKEG